MFVVVYEFCRKNTCFCMREIHLAGFRAGICTFVFFCYIKSVIVLVSLLKISSLYLASGFSETLGKGYFARSSHRVAANGAEEHTQMRMHRLNRAFDIQTHT